MDLERPWIIRMNKIIKKISGVGHVYTPEEANICLLMRDLFFESRINVAPSLAVPYLTEDWKIVKECVNDPNKMRDLMAWTLPKDFTKLSHVSTQHMRWFASLYLTTVRETKSYVTPFDIGDLLIVGSDPSSISSNFTAALIRNGWRFEDHYVNQDE